MTTILNENITFSSIYTAFNGTHNGSAISLASFRGKTFTSGDPVPATPNPISIETDFKGRTAGGAVIDISYTYLKLNSKVYSFSRDGNSRNYGSRLAMSNKYFMVGNNTSGKAYFYVREPEAGADVVDDSGWSSVNPWKEKAILYGGTHFGARVAVSDKGWCFVVDWVPAEIKMYKISADFIPIHDPQQTITEFQGGIQVLEDVLVVTNRISKKCIIYKLNGHIWEEKKSHEHTAAINGGDSGSAITKKWIIAVWGTGASCQAKIIRNGEPYDVVCTIGHGDISDNISPPSMSTANSTFFGIAVGISETELGYDYVMIGARGPAITDVGGVHIFKMEGSKVTHVSTIEQPGASSHEGNLVDYFAISMNASPYYLLIGNMDWTNETNYLFTRRKDETWEVAIENDNANSDYRHNNRAKKGHIMDRGDVNSYTNYALGYEQAISPDSNYILSSAYAGYVVCFKRVDDVAPPPSNGIDPSYLWEKLEGIWNHPLTTVTLSREIGWGNNFSDATTELITNYVDYDTQVLAIKKWIKDQNTFKEYTHYIGFSYHNSHQYRAYPMVYYRNGGKYGDILSVDVGTASHNDWDLYYISNVFKVDGGVGNNLTGIENGARFGYDQPPTLASRPTLVMPTAEEEEEEEEEAAAAAAEEEEEEAAAAAAEEEEAAALPPSLTLHSSSNLSLSGDGSQANPFSGYSTNKDHNSIGKIEFKVVGSGGYVTITSSVGSENGYDEAHIIMHLIDRTNTIWGASGVRTFGPTEYPVANNDIIEFKYTKDESDSKQPDKQQMEIFISAT